jgi:hypothetical protein
VGAYEAILMGVVEASVRYHSDTIGILTSFPSSGRKTVSGGQFDWGGRLLKGNIGVQRFPQIGQKSIVECKGKRKLNCETNKSSRDESRS